MLKIQMLYSTFELRKAWFILAKVCPILQFPVACFQRFYLGTMTLNPFHSDRMLAVPAAVAGLLCVIVPALDIRHTILGRLHYLLFALSLSIQPRLLVTLDESLRPLQATVRVGQAVDVVGQAGRPKTITGFQTHTTPVLLAYGERAELAAQPPAPSDKKDSSKKEADEAEEEYVAYAPVLEGFVILRKEKQSKM